MAPKKQARQSGSPFGQAVRAKAIEAYFANTDAVTADNAWEHVYHLLLSIDRRTRLAHVMDSNHMQPGGSFHGRAVLFTDLLCGRWGIERKELPPTLDHLFRACVEEYLKQREQQLARAVERTVDQIVEAGGGTEEVEESVSEFLIDIADLLVARLGLEKTRELVEVVAEIERRAEHYFTIEKKRQNVRGEGFEDTLEWLLLNVSGVPREQLVVRTAANNLPGFKKPLTSAGKRKDKVPKPDLAVDACGRPDAMDSYGEVESAAGSTRPVWTGSRVLPGQQDPGPIRGLRADDERDGCRPTA